MDQPIRYAAILDAGSSGTRFYIFRWRNWVPDTPLPQFEEIYNEKVGPGAATLLGNNDDGLDQRINNHLTPIFTPAIQRCNNIPVNLDQVPLFFLATAGMRKIENNPRYQNFLARIRARIDQSGFNIQECRTITGEAEALYGWIAANYSWGSFSGYGLRDSHTAGYVEMGGASAQIAIPLYAGAGLGLDEHQGRLVKVKIGPSEFDMFLASYQLGSDEAREQYRRILLTKDRVRGFVIEPSKNYGWGWEDGATFLTPVPADNSPDRRNITNGGQVAAARGRPDQEELNNILAQLPIPGPDPLPTPLPQHLLPALRARTFLGGSNFWYSTRQVFGINVTTGQPKQTPFTFQEYRDEVNFVSSLSWKVCKLRRQGVREDILAEACFTAAWVQRVLFHFFGFQNMDQTSFTPYNGVHRVELSWTLGKVILFALGSQPRELDANVIRHVNQLRGQAKSRDDEQHQRNVDVENALMKIEQLQDDAARINALIADRPNRPAPVNQNMGLDRDVKLQEAAVVQIEINALLMEQEAHLGEGNVLRGHAVVAETNGLAANAIQAPTWF